VEPKEQRETEFLSRFGAKLAGLLGQKESEMPSLRTSIAAIGLTIAGGLSLSACATTDYVDEQVATVNDRVSALESKVQQVDSTAQAAAGSAQSANQRLDQLTGRVDGIEQQLAQRQSVQKRPRN
jgi:murein lipoprotein